MKSLLLDPDLRVRLEKAAKTLGTNNLEELAAALVDAGYLKVPKAPLEVMRLPREEIGRSILASKHPTDKDNEFFERLIPGQQHAVILHLMNDGDSAQNVAGRFWLPVEEVLRIWNRYAASIGEDVMQIRFESFLGTLALRFDDLYSRALQEKRGGPKQAADIMFKYYQMLQELGVLYRAPTKLEYSSTDETRKLVDSEARRIVELQTKMGKVKDAEIVSHTGTNPPETAGA